MLTAEMVVDGLVPSSPVVSPDGRRVAYVACAAGKDDQLWVATGEGAPRRLDVPVARVTAPRWAADSESIFFLADERLYRVGREPADWGSGIQTYCLLADPDLVAVAVADEPADPLVRGNPPPARLRVLDLRTGEVRLLAEFGERHVAEVVQRPGGGPLAVLTWASAELGPGRVEPALHLVDPETGAVTDLGATPAEAGTPVWSGGEVMYPARTPPGLQSGPAVFDGTHRNLTEGMTACPVELVQVDDGAPLVVVADGLDTAVCRLDHGRPVEVFRTTGRLTQLSANGGVLAAIVSTADQPSDVHVGPIGGPLHRRSDTRPELRDVTWGVQERLAYRAADGLALDGLLVLPPGRTHADGPFPLVTLVHGGPDDRYADEFMLHWAHWGQWLAHAGYAAFLPNPRGGFGHGHEFAASVAGAVGQEEWTDILTGIDLLVAEGVADPERLGIGGWSHGGFMAAWAVGQTGRFAAAVMGAGISDWGLQVAAGELDAFDAELAGSTGWEGPGPHPHDRRSPISYASAVRTPVLILHGAEDTNVPLAQSEYFHRALRHHGVEHEFVVYPGEGHSIRQRAHQLDVLTRTRAWFTRHLPPTPDLAG
ncbi:alpha/beta hydrolase family protein [Amycolatopsis suaedae]|uniref:S9 family peptidase n=1 Tax=Amycolatopsis suaedae TaxID=2510978 RepID=A0A4Q7JAZ7_9PSEU|nr:S9 family peptidase [Amycolatopsis suaedae]RZQ64447.1 S9 family peptidase [Amycolatopsis suaedae]